MLENRPGTGRGVTWAAASCASQFTLAVRRARGGRAGAHLHELPGGACGCRCSLQACSCSTRDRPPPTHGGLVLALLGSITVSYLQKKKHNGFVALWVICAIAAELYTSTMVVSGLWSLSLYTLKGFLPLELRPSLDY